MPMTAAPSVGPPPDAPFADIIAEEGIPYFRRIDRVDGPRVWIEGRPLLSLAHSDYLGFSREPSVRAAAAAALDRYGTSCAGSPVLNGYCELHHELEQELAAFLGQDDVALLASGYQANLGALASCQPRGGRVLCDRLAHASLLDAVRLARAPLVPFAHNDPLALDDLLGRTGEQAASSLVVVEGVYSVDGDHADLEAITAVCRRHGARLLVDEAHSLGTVGPGGRGRLASLPERPADVVVTGTFSKALAATGGFVAGSRADINRLRQTARPLVFSAALAPPVAAAALAALRLLIAEPARGAGVVARADALRAALRSAGYRVLGGGTPILALECADGEAAWELWRRLFDRGIFVNAIIPPAVPAGCGRLRLAVNHLLQPADLEQVVDTFAALVAHYRPGAAPRESGREGHEE